MSQTSSRNIDESALTKGQLRKLNGLRRSVGQVIGERAFAEWLPSQAATETDRNAELIAENLWALVQESQLRIRPGGYVVKRGRGRIVVEPARKIANPYRLNPIVNIGSPATATGCAATPNSRRPSM